MTVTAHNRESTSISLYGAHASRGAASKTFVCMGTARGGTSMIAGAMRALGVNMGEHLGDTHEDPAFAGRGLPAMAREVERRNGLGLSHWGWKFPNAANYLDRLRPHLVNPHLVMVTRDLVATAKGHMRWHARDELTALSDVLLTSQRNLFLCITWQVPALIVSYEKAMAFPQSFIDEFCGFAGLEPPADCGAIVSFMTPGSYKDAPDRRQGE